jgi:hypothetical protein
MNVYCSEHGKIIMFVYCTLSIGPVNWNIVLCQLFTRPSGGARYAAMEGASHTTVYVRYAARGRPCKNDLQDDSARISIF